MVERRNALQRKIDAWMEIQQLYMPGVAGIRARQAAAFPSHTPPLTHDIALCFPSDVMNDISCDKVLVDCEFRLRVALGHDILEDLRRHLRLRSHLYGFKDRFVRGQRPNTRAQSIISSVQSKVDADAQRYRKNHAALVVLGNELDCQSWRGELRPLEPDDVRGMSDGLFGETEGRRSLSWIWRTVGVADPCTGNTSEGLQEGAYAGAVWCMHAQ